MKKFFRISLIVLFVLLLCGTFIFLWQKTRPKKVVYELVTPKIDTIVQNVVATGKVEPRDEVLIKPQISGIVSTVVREEGEMIKKGDIIATVNVVPEMGALNSAESRVNMAQINLESVQKEYSRAKELFEKGVISTEEFDKNQVSLKTALEDLETAKGNLDIIKTGVSKRTVNMANTQIRSTINGMILSIPIKVGNSVIQSNTFNDGTTIASIADMGDMIFIGKVDETDVGKLKENMGVTLTIGAMQDTEIDAILEYISPKATEVNGVIMFEIKAAAKIPAKVFVRSGYSANASIVIDRREGILTIPESCVEFKDKKAFVNVLTSAADAPEQTFESREIKIGFSDGVNVEIVEGLTAKDTVRGNKKSTKSEIKVEKND